MVSKYLTHRYDFIAVCTSLPRASWIDGVIFAFHWCKILLTISQQKLREEFLSMVSIPKVVSQILHCFLIFRKIICYSVSCTGWLIIMPNYSFPIAAWMHYSRCSFFVHDILTVFYTWTHPLKYFLYCLCTYFFTACKGVSHWKKRIF